MSNQQTTPKSGRVVRTGSVDARGGESRPVDMSLSRLPPQAIALEEAILSACMIDNQAFPKVSTMPKEAFYATPHKSIFEAMLGLHNDQFPIDLLTLMDRLKSNGNLDTIGGPAFLAHVSTKVTSSANIEYHARLVMQQYYLRECIQTGNDLINKAYDETTDPLDLVDSMQRSLLRLMSFLNNRHPEFVSSIVGKVIEDLFEARNSDKDLLGISTGIEEWDWQTGGFVNSDLIVLAARPAMGKTSMALWLSKTIAQTGKGVGFISLEMSSKQLLQRMMASISKVNSLLMRQPGAIQEDEWARLTDATNVIDGLKIQIDDSPGQNILQIRSTAREMVMKGAELLIVDYLQLASSTNKNHDEYTTVTQISQGLKALAKELDIPVIALSQLSRSVETRGGDKRPLLRDLRASGAIEQDADLVAFLYRPEYYKILEDEEGNSLIGCTELIIGKNRHGDCTTIKLRMDPATADFEAFENDPF